MSLTNEGEGLGGDQMTKENWKAPIERRSFSATFKRSCIWATWLCCCSMTSAMMSRTEKEGQGIRWRRTVLSIQFGKSSRPNFPGLNCKREQLLSISFSFIARPRTLLGSSMEVRRIVQDILTHSISKTIREPMNNERSASTILCTNERNEEEPRLD